MNYYERHVGDYIKDTVGLSMLEDGAYNRLIDQCYANEAPLPADLSDVYRTARARTLAERKAVDYVLKKFFTMTDRGYEQKRIMAEIERYAEGEPEREAKKANKKERQRRWLERRSRLFAALRDFDIVPPFDASMTDLRRMVGEISDASRDASQTTSQTTTSPQSPLPSTSPANAGEGKRGSRRASSPKVTQIWLTTEEMQVGNEDLTADMANEYLAYRKTKRSALTRHAWDSIVEEIRKTRRPIDKALGYAMNRGWIGFEYEWVVKDVQQARGAVGKAARDAATDEWVDGLLMKGAHEQQQQPAGDDFIDVDSRVVGS